MRCVQRFLVEHAAIFILLKESSGAEILYRTALGRSLGVPLLYVGKLIRGQRGINRVDPFVDGDRLLDEDVGEHEELVRGRSGFDHADLGGVR